MKKAKTRVFNSKHEKTITKQMLERDMYEFKLSQREIAKKYKVGKGTIQNLQYLYKLEILNLFQRRVPRTLTYEQKQLILGTVIADGHVFRKNKKRHGALSIKHSIKQEEWVDCKYNVLKDFVRTKPTIQISKINEKVYKCKSFRTLTHDFFTYIHDLCYKDKIKYLNKNILDKIDAGGLAVAYMDDGTVHHKQRDFCFECYPYEEQEIFCKWLNEKFDLKARVIRYKQTKWRTRIYSWQKFDKIVEPFLIDSMKYKIQKSKNK